MIKKLSRTLYLSTFLFSILSILTIGALWIAYDYREYQENLHSFKTEYIKNEKEILKNEVDRVISLIEYNNSLKYTRINQLVKNRIEEVDAIINSIFTKYKATKTKDEIVEIIKETVRGMRFFNNWGYYFMYDLNSKLIMHGLKPEFEGTYKFRDFTDLNGKKVLQELVYIAKTKKEGFLEWTFYRPDKPNVQADKLGYIKLIEPLNYFIGTADYTFRVEEELKLETLSRISNISYGEDGYIFVLKDDGTTLSNKKYPKFEGKTLSSMSEKFRQLIQEVLKTSEKEGEGFVQYLLPEHESEKLTFVYNYEKWNWVIGTGKHLVDLDKLLIEKEQELAKKIEKKILYITIFLFIVILLVLGLSRIFIKKIDKSLSVFITFFKKVNIENKKLPITKLPFVEFQELAVCINEMLDTKIEQEKDILLKNKEVLVNSSLLNEYKKAVDASTIVSKTDKEGVITYVNDEFCKISGYSRNELLGNKHNIVKHPKVNESVYKQMWQKILNKKVWKGVLENRTKDGVSYFVKITIVPILDIESNIKEFIAIRYDVTNLIKQANKIKFQTTDLLTKLPNRQKLLECLEYNDLKLAIFDIVRFKEINEYYGYDIGDEVIKNMAEILKEFIKNQPYSLYKIQGDEFAILANEKISIEAFKEMSRNLVDHIGKNPLNVKDNALDIHIVGGISFQKNYLINAEMAKNFAKESKTDLIIFDENINIKDNIVENITRTKQLKKALISDRVVIFIQPIILNSNNSIHKYECLVRMLDDDGEIISPMAFLTIAKKSNLYLEITRTVITKAFEYFSIKDDDFSINLTIEDILSPEINNLIYQKLQEFPQTANRVIFEIVEDEGIENYDEVSSFIEKMKSYGCKIAIDDFGTGYSNFDYLMKLNVDFIKIDGSMIRYLDYDENAKLVTQLIVDFAKKLKIKTIAEFVHSSSIDKIVKEMDIDYSQGFYLGEPKKI